MKTQQFGDIRKMRNDEGAGFGPSYISDPKGPGFLFWVEDCFQPTVWFVRAESFEEAHEHAEAVLCEIDHEVEAEASRLGNDWDAIEDLSYRNGCTYAADGRIRYSETLRGVELGR